MGFSLRARAMGKPQRRTSKLQRTPHYMREYAERLEAEGLDGFRHLAGPILVGIGMVGELAAPKGSKRRRTHAVEGETEYIPVTSLLDRVWRLKPGDHPMDERFIAVGHSADADVVIPDYSLSSLHAAFTCTRPMAVTDLRSLNGTVVNGVAVEPRAFVTIGNGDEIRLGRLLLRFHDGPGFIDALRDLH